MALPTPGSDRTALVTGASSGIGTELARELARRGYGLTLVARRADALEELARDLRSPLVRVEVVAGDLADPNFRESLPSRVAELGLHVDVVVNNAGFSTSGPVHRADAAGEVALVEVDVVAVTELCTRFLPGMVERRSGAVLNVASVAGFQPLPGQAAYGAAKAFVLSYTQALAGELAGTGVTVTALCPGPVRTGFAAAAGFSDREFEGAMPSFMMVPAADVARAGVEGLERGRAVVIPGTANRLTAVAGRFSPRRVLVKVIAGNHPALKRG